MTVLGKRPQNDVLGVRPSGSQKDDSRRVLNRDCFWKMNIAGKIAAFCNVMSRRLV